MLWGDLVAARGAVQREPRADLGPPGGEPDEVGHEPEIALGVMAERAALGRGAALVPELQPCGGLPVAGVLDPVSGEPLLCDRAPDVHRGAQAGAVPVDTRGDPDAVALATHD